ncbi:D-inositol-3-phosphate glycosyltransferase [uncultured archaeon]|nr:D-inositol-3-phosphate glycosyltransferase [uncultured archaeon]
MRIAIINLTGGGMSGGYRKYLQNVIPRMAAHPDIEAILCASQPYLKVQDWFEPLTNVNFIDCKPYRLFGYRTDSELNKNLKKFSSDVVFVPTERFFRFNGVPVVNMIQNMEPFVSGIDGNPLGERFKIWVQRIDAKRSILKSNRVIAISDFVRDFLIQQWNIPDDKIGLVYHGIDLPENKNVERPAAIPENMEGQFLFTAGSIRPARGIEEALYALSYLNDKCSNIKLVIAGETSSGMKKYRKSLESWIEMHNLRSRVFWTESLNEKEMAWCYRNSLAFVMTSRVESFGMIAGEAMAHCCVCIAADNPCLPEIFGDSAIYYPPKDYKALANAIQTVLSLDKSQRNEASQRARKRAAQFSWDITAERTVSELVKAVESFRLK